VTRREVSVIVSTNYSTSAFRRTFSLTAVQVIVAALGLMALVMLIGLLITAVSAARLARLEYLERRNRDLEREFAKLGQLKQRVEELEATERKMAAMLGVEQSPPPIDWSSGRIDTTAAMDSTRWGARPRPTRNPVPGAVVSRTSGTSHLGIDLAAQSGTPVLASGDGIVIGRGTDSVFGRFLLVSHLEGYDSYYGHLSDWRVASGDTVRQGQTIGLVGSTGRSSAPHLHFEIRKDRQPLDPRTLVRF